MQIVRCPDSLVGLDSPSLFLAGPSSAAPIGAWRDEVLTLLNDRSFPGTVLYPEPAGQAVTTEVQAMWDLRGCERATVVMFWIPRDLRTMPGLTSNFELGMWIRSGKVVVGSPPEADAMAYLRVMAARFSVPQAETLIHTTRLAERLIAKRTHR